MGDWMGWMVDKGRALNLMIELIQTWGDETILFQIIVYDRGGHKEKRFLQ